MVWVCIDLDPLKIQTADCALFWIYRRKRFLRTVLRPICRHLALEFRFLLFLISIIYRIYLSMEDLLCLAIFRYGVAVFRVIVLRTWKFLLFCEEISSRNWWCSYILYYIGFILTGPWPFWNFGISLPFRETTDIFIITSFSHDFF